MSTRAMIIIKDGYSQWNLYAHHDGYPSFMQKLIEKVIRRTEDCDIPNVRIEADKFTTYLIGQFYKEDYNSLYMTKRDVRKEMSEGTDIEYLYVVDVSNKMELKSYKITNKMELL